MYRGREKTCFQMLVLSMGFPLCPEKVSMNNDIPSYFLVVVGFAAAGGVLSHE